MYDYLELLIDRQSILNEWKQRIEKQAFINQNKQKDNKMYKNVNRCTQYFEHMELKSLVHTIENKHLNKKPTKQQQ